ncbi:aminopeptidase N [Actibacterium sp. 188UL27-1]|uniref:aminopeptidase N n=1 Tax=Actibacterium sp. 188UL27-1 TaxID=2786961 RepID=UPI00195753E6|nr:aminopeptidase N [Actibacterium sp. 188UL27-1]MBM7066971.1 aminopeptidase N [Actibacterium sp. 188UL27-1]
MRDAAPQTIYLKDYTPFPWQIEWVKLTFKLAPTGTRVLSEIRFAPNPDADGGEFFLHGEQLALTSSTIDGIAVSPTLTDEGLTCDVPDGAFTWTAEVEIAPEKNTALEGLYMSNGMYCTQCEAEGFRKITYYPDRPDVMAPFTVRIEGNAPVLLSNGNPTGQGDGWAEWHDPWPKPAYLFALVAGDLTAVTDSFTTASGMSVTLNIWVRHGDQGKCDYAMDALKRSMRWDEKVYGREYDLDVFNIVAVDDFNMGAMENKGLNIFNSKYVLASPKTATDRDYEFIEAIIAHEYFHNWTGNRITCRDWFQLCLKEGLTVYRDQQFSGDMRSHAVKRIDDVVMLRARQFREDAGPLAHPVRPSSYIEINNFYTATVYEKGAEVIGMLRTLVGAEGYKTALDLYFERHDGDAATIEDFRKCFEDACDIDLTQFALWWHDPGTPRVTVTEAWADGTLSLHLKQSTQAAGRDDYNPRIIPLVTALIAPDGSEAMEQVVVKLTEAEHTVRFPMLTERPIVSINRGFSAPVIIERDSSTEERAFLLAHDTDPFNRWEAGRALAKDVLTRMVTDGDQPGPAYLNALDQMARDDRLDPSFRALALGLPSDDDMAQTLADSGITPDPTRIYTARLSLRKKVAEHLEPALAELYTAMDRPGPYTPDAKAAGCRALRLKALGYLSLLDGGKRAQKQFDTADNMTEQLSALACLIDIGTADEALAAFARQWSSDRLVMDKWFALQVAGATPADAATIAKSLTEHPDFDWKNPNRFRSVIGALTTNAAGFHDPSGASYSLIIDWLITLDALNHQTTARMTTAFETWRRYDADRQGLIRENLERLAAKSDLSRDVTEMVSRILGT